MFEAIKPNVKLEYEELQKLFARASELINWAEWKTTKTGSTAFLRANRKLYKVFWFKDSNKFYLDCERQNK